MAREPAYPWALDHFHNMIVTWGWDWWFPNSDEDGPQRLSSGCRGLAEIGDFSYPGGQISDEEYAEILHWHNRDGDMSAKEIVLPRKVRQRHRLQCDIGGENGSIDQGRGTVDREGTSRAFIVDDAQRNSSENVEASLYDWF